jgi:hypothetical protein
MHLVYQAAESYDTNLNKEISASIPSNTTLKQPIRQTKATYQIIDRIFIYFGVFAMAYQGERSWPTKNIRMIKHTMTPLTPAFIDNKARIIIS